MGSIPSITLISLVLNLVICLAIFSHLGDLQASPRVFITGTGSSFSSSPLSVSCTPEPKHTLYSLPLIHQELPEVVRRISTEDRALVSTDTIEFMRFIQLFNQASPWRNINVFPLEKNFVPLIIRAANRSYHLKRTLEKLRFVERVNRTVLIVSHDSINYEVMELVNQIDFMVVRQIVHPFSSNIFRDRFPGTDDSIRSIDQYNNGRTNSRYPGMRTHFHWHLSFVWRHLLPETVQHVFLLEDDLYPSFDLYIALKSLLKISDDIYPESGILLGHTDSYVKTDPRSVYQAVTSPSSCSYGLSFSRATWEILRDNVLSYCSYPDYNWDLTLTHFRKLGVLPSNLVIARWPRLMHYGFCSSTHQHQWKAGKFDDCETKEEAAIQEIENVIEPTLRQIYETYRSRATKGPYRSSVIYKGLESDWRDLFLYSDDDEPYYLLADSFRWEGVLHIERAGKPNGGWVDEDQALCTQILDAGHHLLPPTASISISEVHYVELGCFVDHESARDLSVLIGRVDTVEDCVIQCRMKRLPIAGLQNGGECRCGLSHGLYGSKDGFCSKLCPSGQKCGGKGLNLVFRISDQDATE